MGCNYSSMPLLQRQFSYTVVEITVGMSNNTSHQTTHIITYPCLIPISYLLLEKEA